MITGKLSSKSQITLPLEVRVKLGLGPGDFIVYEVTGDAIQIRKLRAFDVEFHRSLESTLSEWGSAEDNEAFDDL